jgi:hypothetical protein
VTTSSKGICRPSIWAMNAMPETDIQDEETGGRYRRVWRAPAGQTRPSLTSGMGWWRSPECPLVVRDGVPRLAARHRRRTTDWMRNRWMLDSSAVGWHRRAKLSWLTQSCRVAGVEPSTHRHRELTHKGGSRESSGPQAERIPAQTQARCGLGQDAVPRTLPSNQPLCSAR